jgi:predicted PurR-regulated permease PerM
MIGMEDRSLNVSITTSTIVKCILLGLLLWLLFILRDIVLDVLTAIVIASAIEPGVIGLRRRKVPRILAVIIVYLVLFGVFFGIFLFVVPTLLSDITQFVSSLPMYLNTFGQAGALDPYATMLGIPKPSDVSVNDIMQGIRDSLDLGAFGNVFSAATKIFGGVFSFVIIIVFSFYFAVIETGVDDFLQIIVPKNHQSYALDLWRRSQHKIGLWMQGQLILAVLMGVIVYLALSLFQVPHALVLALIAAVFEIIPVFGPTLAAIPAVTVAFVSGGATLGLITIAIYVIAQQFENHLIYPQVVTRVVGVPPLLVILALIIGADLAGFLGVILSVPAAATIQELVRDIESGRFSLSKKA